MAKQDLSLDKIARLIMNELRAVEGRLGKHISSVEGRLEKRISRGFDETAKEFAVVRHDLDTLKVTARVLLAGNAERDAQMEDMKRRLKRVEDVLHLKPETPVSVAD